MRSLQRLTVFLTAAFFLLGGCGRKIQAPAALNYTLSTAVYVKGVAIAPDTPTSSGGAVTSYSVSPALPSGLTLDASSGIISGTPTAVSKAAAYMVSASNKSGSTVETLTVTVNPGPLSANDINLIFLVSEDWGYQAAGDVSPSTGNLTSQGLQRTLLMATYLQQHVLGMKNVTGIYALSPMTHLQTTNGYPDMAPLESVQQFAVLNRITLPSDPAAGTQYTDNSYPINTSYAPGGVPVGVATPLIPCEVCQGLDFSDVGRDNEALLKTIVQANVPGFYVFSAPWETASTLLANIDNIEGYGLTVPSTYAGPNNVYAISITPSGSASLGVFNANLKPASSYPTLPSPVVSAGCPAKTAPFKIVVTGGTDGAVIPADVNTNETFYIVRHVEAHPQSTFEDGNFVAAGQWRALDLPNTLKGKISPDQVMSVDPAQALPLSLSTIETGAWSYVRTVLTVAPYAIANDLPYTLAASFEMLAQNPPQLSTQASAYFFTGGKFDNQKVLLGWEHDHIPPTVNALLASYFPRGGGRPPAKYTAPNWPDVDYDGVWTVTLDSVGNLSVDNSICQGIDSASLPATAPPF